MGASVRSNNSFAPWGSSGGQNLNYKSMGLTAFMILFGSSLNVLGVLMGYDIIMLAVTTIIGIILTSAAELWIVRRNVVWFGVEKPRRQELIDSIRLSCLGSLTTLSGMLLTSADTIIIGMTFGQPLQLSI